MSATAPLPDFLKDRPDEMYDIDWSEIKGVGEVPKLSPEEVAHALLKTNFEGAIAAYAGENTDLVLDEAEMSALTTLVEAMALSAKSTVDMGMELRPGSKAKMAYDAYMKKRV